MRFTTILAVGVFMIAGIALLKMKPVYQISLDGEMIGYVKNRNQFEEILEVTYNDNEELNIAFADFDVEMDYEFKLINRTTRVNEKTVLAAINEKADITYYQYAVIAGGVEKEYFCSEEQANELASSLSEKLADKAGVSVERIYTKQLKETSSVEIATISDTIATQIDNEIKAEERKEKSTINGVHIAVMPVKGNVSSRFGSRESIRDHAHKGLDIATKQGTDIKAAATGTVSFSGTKNGYGNLIIIDHGNGITTYYGHCSKLYKEVGDEVVAGDVIAAVGSTGRSTGPHLHFEIRKNGEYVNPAQYLFI